MGVIVIVLSSRIQNLASLLQRNLDIPPPKALPNFPEGRLLPPCIVADEAFPLCCDLMRQYLRVRRNKRLLQDQQI